MPNRPPYLPAFQKSRRGLCRCKVHGARHAGVVLSQDGTASAEGCDISGNASAGVVIGERAQPRFLRCTIRGNGDVGVLGISCAEGRIEGCDLTGNAGGGLEVQPGCPLVLENNTAG